MAWARLDDQFFANPKVMRAGRDARDLYLAAMCYCAAQLTDGHVPHEAIRLLGAQAEIDDTECAIARLIENGLWTRTDAGYCIHDWRLYNPPAEEVKRKRELNAARQQSWRERQVEERQAQRKKTRNAPRNALRNALVTASVTHPPSHTPIENTLMGELSVIPLAPVAAAPTPVDGPKVKPGSKPRPRNPMWDAIVEAVGYDPVGKSEEGKFGKAVHDLNALGASSEDIRARAANHQTMYESGVISWALTPQALVSNWGKLGRVTAPPKRGGGSLPPGAGHSGAEYGKIARL